MSSTILDRLIRGDIPTDFNWNADRYNKIPLISQALIEPSANQITKLKFVSEDLRDGLHGIAEYPTTELMTQYVDLLIELGISAITVGIYPGEKNKIDTSIRHLLSYLNKKHPKVTPIILTLATEASMAWAGQCKQLNPNLNAIVFMGTAPSRMLAEDWNKKFVLEKLAWGVKTAIKTYHIDVIGATEHTTQTPPDFLRDIITTVVNNGAKYFCIADTIGIARPIGTTRIVRYVKTVLHDLHADHVLVDWHGHEDLGNGLGNAMAAIAAGADRIHTVAHGMGERAGNTPLESVLLNCSEILSEKNKKNPWDLHYLTDILTLYNKLTGDQPPTHGPLGTRAFRTSLGIHTSAMLKAERLIEEAKGAKKSTLVKKLEAMSRKIYCAIDASTVGREREIRVGPWSGKSTVQLAAITLGKDPSLLTEEIISSTLMTAKKLGRELTTKELIRLLHDISSS